MGIFSRKKEERAAEVAFEDSLLQALLSSTAITKAVAMQIPTIGGAIGLISNVIAGTPIKLYEDKDGKAIEVKGDDRVKLLNDDTGDTLNAVDFWKAIVSDYYLGKGGYAYIRKAKSKFVGVHYVDESRLVIQINTDPIMKSFDILVDGKSYLPMDFIKILRNSKDGASGTPITVENSKLLEVIHESLIFESNLVKKGGNKKGFLQSLNKLGQPEIDALKAAFARLYSNNSENVVVLNKGIEFKESSNTSVEMQLNENKTANSEESSKLFHISAALIAGKASDDDLAGLVKLAAMPLMRTIQCALNKDFLLEKEKGKFYWAFDTKELLKGNTKDRFEALAMGVEKGFITRNEARYSEDLPAIDGLDCISMTLADVIYDINTKTYFTPNTKTITKTDAPAGVENTDAPVIPTDKGVNE